MPGPEILNLLDEIRLDTARYSKLSDDLDNFLPCEAGNIFKHVKNTYGLDLSGSYAGIPLPHPFGKAAGQLSMSPGHVTGDRESGLAFTVLKSAVGVTESGDMGIDAWEKSAPKMVVEKRISSDGRDGWTVTWKGRGWDKGFNAYLELYKTSLEQNPGYPIIPSFMVDVTDRARAIEQAKYCLGKITEIHRSIVGEDNFLVEIDISPTLNLLDGSDDENIFEGWVRTSVAAFREGIGMGGKYIVKLPNAGRGPGFQLRILNASIEEGGEKLAGAIVGNRLFDRDAGFEGQRGIAYGGWDLSSANLETLDSACDIKIDLNFIGTGNICSGKIMAEYALRGCTAGELHTFFQLPPTAYRALKGSGGRINRALRGLLFHPDDGLVAVMLKLGESGILQRSGENICFSDLPEIYDTVRSGKC